MRDRHDREVLDRVDLRLDQEVDVDPDEVGDEEPDAAPGSPSTASDDTGLAAPEPEPLVDGVEQPLDRLEDPVEGGHDERGRGPG